MFRGRRFESNRFKHAAIIDCYNSLLLAENVVYTVSMDIISIVFGLILFIVAYFAIVSKRVSTKNKVIIKVGVLTLALGAFIFSATRSSDPAGAMYGLLTLGPIFAVASVLLFVVPDGRATRNAIISAQEKNLRNRHWYKIVSIIGAAAVLLILALLLAPKL